MFKMPPALLKRSFVLYFLLLLPKCLIHGADNNDDFLTTKYDFVIVGAGSAGSVVAGCLSENPSVKVLLLEAGEYPPPESEIPAEILMGTKYDWQFKVTPQFNACLTLPNNQCSYNRGKALGGTGTLNSMMYIRGNHKDYDNWVSMGNEGWSWKDVLPYFKKAEGNTIKWIEHDTYYHSSKGPLTVSEPPFPQTESSKLFLKSSEAQGYKIIDVNGKSQVGFMPIAFTIRDGARCSSFIAYLLPALDRKNLKVLTQAQVTKIILDDNKRAVGVTFSRNGSEYNVTATKEVIISAGVIQSPQILMLSGIGPADHLKKFKIPVVVDLPGVGSNFRDHVVNSAPSWSSVNLQTISAADPTSNKSLTEWLYFRRGPRTVPLGLESVGFVSSSKNWDKNWPDLQIIFVSTSNPFVTQGNGLISCIALLLRPKTTGFIRLQSADGLASPLINMQYLSNEDDANRLLEGTKMCLKLVNPTAYQGYNLTLNTDLDFGCKKFLPNTDEYFKCVQPFTTTVGLHAVGTCKMGPVYDTMAVVDPVGLSVYKVKGLRVIDASVIPQAVSGNPNTAIIMVAEKACDAIKRTWSLN
ncbi:hypothetical protein CHUAL_006862 [Chamberlinius hualienensis]